MPRVSISAAARLCRCSRGRLQHAIRTGRLHLDAQHRLDTGELVREGFATVEQVAHAPPPRPPPNVYARLEAQITHLEHITTTLAHIVEQLTSMLAAERDRRRQEPPGEDAPRTRETGRE